jgi:hypothetical protein
VTQFTPTVEQDPVDAAQYIAPHYLRPETLAEIRAWYLDGNPRPLPLPGFLVPEFARDLGAVLRAVPTYSRHAAIYHGQLDKTEFWDAEADADRRVTIAQYVVKNIGALLDEGTMEPGRQRVLERFFTFVVLSDIFRTWLFTGTGLRLRKRTVMEMACYRQSDGLNPHQDLVPGRVLAANFYLDEKYVPEHGGRLGFRNGAGTEYRVEPQFNTLSLMPIREDCWHWVEPFEAPEVGRFTIAVAEHQEEV